MRDAGQPTQGAGNPELGLSVRPGQGCPQDSKEEAARGCGLARAAGEGRRGASLMRRFGIYFPFKPCVCPRVPCCVLTPGHPLLIPAPRILQESQAWGALTPRRTPLSSSATPHSLGRLSALPALVPNQGTSSLQLRLFLCFWLNWGTHLSPASGKIGRSGRKSLGERPFAEFCLWSSPLFLPSKRSGDPHRIV